MNGKRVRATANLSWDANSTGRRNMLIDLFDSTDTRKLPIRARNQRQAELESEASLSTVFEAATGHYVMLRVHQNSGGSRNTGAGGEVLLVVEQLN